MVNVKVKAGLKKDTSGNLQLILKETQAPGSATITSTPVPPPDSKYEDPFPEKRVETGNKIASIMAEEK